jgi:hypothetical protein
MQAEKGASPFRNPEGFKKGGDVKKLIESGRKTALPEMLSKEGKFEAFEPAKKKPLGKKSGKPITDQGPSAMDVASFINSFLPVTGDIQSAAEGYQAFKDKDYLGASLGAVGLIPFVPSITKYVRNAEKASKGTKFEEAFKTAQKNAALPVEKGGLGLPKNNTALDRAKAMGFDTNVYHGTKQDIVGGFKPVYSDNLTFTTTSPQFASDWIGKGAKQQRAGEIAEQERQQAYEEFKAIRSKNMDPDTLNNLKGDEFTKEYDRRAALTRAVLAKEGLSGMADKIHGNILPLKAGVKKTFNPSQDYKLMDEYIKSVFPNEKSNGNVLNMFKKGDYIVYETPKAVEYLKNLGYDSMLLRETSSGPKTTLAIFDPVDVRSINAAFDPLRRKESDILAGVAAAPAGMLAIDRQKKEKSEPAYKHGGEVTDFIKSKK